MFRVKVNRLKKSTEQEIYFINQPKMRDILQKTFPNFYIEQMLLKGGLNLVKDKYQ